MTQDGRLQRNSKYDIILQSSDLHVNAFTVTIALSTKRQKEGCLLEFENDPLFRSMKTLLGKKGDSVRYLNGQKKADGLFFEYSLMSGWSDEFDHAVSLDNFDLDVLNAVSTVCKLCESSTGHVYFREKDIYGILGGKTRNPKDSTLFDIRKALHKLSNTWIWLDVYQQGELTPQNQRKAIKIEQTATQYHEKNGPLTKKSHYRIPLLDIRTVTTSEECNYTINGQPYKPRDQTGDKPTVGNLFILNCPPFTWITAKESGFMLNKPYSKLSPYIKKNQRKKNKTTGINTKSQGLKQCICNYFDSLIPYMYKSLKNDRKEFTISFEAIAKGCNVWDQYTYTPKNEKDKKANRDFRYRFKKIVLTVLEEKKDQKLIDYFRIRKNGKGTDTLQIEILERG